MTSSRFRKPTLRDRYKLGSQMSKELETVCTLDEEVAAELGTTRANAHMESVLALGTLAWRIRERVLPVNVLHKVKENRDAHTY